MSMLAIRPSPEQCRAMITIGDNHTMQCRRGALEQGYCETHHPLYEERRVLQMVTRVLREMGYKPQDKP